MGKKEKLLYKDENSKRADYLRKIYKPLALYEEEFVSYQSTLKIIFIKMKLFKNLNQVKNFMAQFGQLRKILVIDLKEGNMTSSSGF